MEAVGSSESSVTVDGESDHEEVYQRNGGASPLLLNASSPADRRFVFGLLTRRELLGFVYLGIGFVVTCAVFGIIAGVFWSMPWQGWISMYVMIVAMFLLIMDYWDASLTFFGALVLLLLMQIVTVKEALEGFSNSAIAAIGALFIVAEAVDETQLLEFVVSRVLGHPKNTYYALLRFLPVVVALSAFTNNTPLVLIFLRLLQSWSVRVKLPLTRLLMPLSFASILGGVITIIGTSTNLVVQGLAYPLNLGFFEVGILGLPLSVLGLVYMVLLAKFLLPESSSRMEYVPVAQSTHVVSPESDVVGKSARQAGLMDIPGALLVRVKRQTLEEEEKREEWQRALSVMSFRDVDVEVEPLQQGDVLFFVGIRECVSAVKGLSPTFEDRGVFVVTFECYVSSSQAEVSLDHFQRHFSCRVLSISRDGKVQDAVALASVKRDDVLVVEASYAFLHHASDNTFKKVSMIEQIRAKPRKSLWERMQPLFVLVLLLAMVILAIFDFVDLFALAGTVAVLVVALRVITWEQAMRSVQGKLLLLIACSFPLATALQRWGVASNMARGLSLIFKAGGAYTQLMGIFIATAILTNVVSNAAAASVMYPIVVQIVRESNNTISIRAALYTLMVAASFAFATPIGYQTNLIVYDAGGYTWMDFFKFGGPLTVLCAVVAPAISMGAWPPQANATIIANATMI